MAKIFLDTNYFIDAIHRKPEEDILDRLENHIVYFSTLSAHIYHYAFKIKVPSTWAMVQIEKLQAVDFSLDIMDRAMEGPSFDFEDNVQLHSAAEAECDFFITNDKKLVDMKFFGRTQIIRPENLK